MVKGLIWGRGRERQDGKENHHKSIPMCASIRQKAMSASSQAPRLNKNITAHTRNPNARNPSIDALDTGAFGSGPLLLSGLVQFPFTEASGF